MTEGLLELAGVPKDRKGFSEGKKSGNWEPTFLSMPTFYLHVFL